MTRSLVLAAACIALIAATAAADPVLIVAGSDDGWLSRLRVTDLTIGYRHEELADTRADGAAVRVVWAHPDSGFELEWMPAAAWGGDSFAHVELALGVRYVVNRDGHVRPFALVSPFASFGHTATWAYGVGANAGVGLDVDLPAPGIVSFDVRAGQALDVDSEQASGWQVLATVSIGLHVPRAVQRTPAGQ